MSPLYILSTIVPHYLWSIDVGVDCKLLRGMCPRRFRPMESEWMIGVSSSQGNGIHEIGYTSRSSLMRIHESKVDIVCFVCQRWVWWWAKFMSRLYPTITTEPWISWLVVILDQWKHGKPWTCVTKDYQIHPLALSQKFWIMYSCENKACMKSLTSDSSSIWLLYNKTLETEDLVVRAI